MRAVYFLVVVVGTAGCAANPRPASLAAVRAKVKSPFEFVASALRATHATITKVRSFVGTIAAMGEPLYQCQPPTGYGDRAAVWVNAGTLLSRLNFALGLAANGFNAAKVDIASLAPPDDLSPATRAAILDLFSRFIVGWAAA
jgi:uncharacterized protein (DUF1800 family)